MLCHYQPIQRFEALIRPISLTLLRKLGVANTKGILILAIITNFYTER
ncbi:hypothetical protein Sez_0433 [Streptococcus equi subsp. zooepidemicus MGCS10565]|uniref:Uncharacterized protein n=1 Tax=Streptococcus equi subsp. zooepidemicus (strain MGCS10565) TaxID=552526 RepID=B4U1D8_STREM|nr:hypothetical protein Sez_0433 [Streptococcus equi subsp. zooepidemicus MGCS10565]